MCAGASGHNLKPSMDSDAFTKAWVTGACARLRQQSFGSTHAFRLVRDGASVTPEDRVIVEHGDLDQEVSYLSIYQHVSYINR